MPWIQIEVGHKGTEKHCCFHEIQEFKYYEGQCYADPDFRITFHDHCVSCGTLMSAVFCERHTRLIMERAGGLEEIISVLPIGSEVPDTVPPEWCKK